jgi:hypothetical protein
VLSDNDFGRGGRLPWNTKHNAGEKKPNENPRSEVAAHNPYGLVLRCTPLGYAVGGELEGEK